MKVLITMHPGLLRRRPTRGIDRRRPRTRVALLHPMHQQANRVLRRRITPQPRRNPLRRRRADLHGREPLLLHHGLADIDMVRVQVVRDIRVHARPRLERLELRLRLTHVTVEVIEVPQTMRLEARIRVRRVIALVVLDVDEDAVLGSGFQQREMVRERLDSRLRDQHVDLAFDGVQGDRVVRCVGREDRDCVARGQGIDCRLVRLGVFFVVGGVARESCVETVVELGDVLVEMCAWESIALANTNGLDLGSEGGGGNTNGWRGTSSLRFRPWRACRLFLDAAGRTW